MSAADVLAEVEREVDPSGKATPRALEMVKEGIRRFPKSAALWNRRGDLIQVSDEDGLYSLGDALASYRRAVALDPQNEEAKLEIANLLDLHGELDGRAD